LLRADTAPVIDSSCKTDPHVHRPIGACIFLWQMPCWRAEVVDAHIVLSAKHWDRFGQGSNCSPPAHNCVQPGRRTWSTGVPWALMPRPKLPQPGQLDAVLRNAGLWGITFSTERCNPTGCEFSQLAPGTSVRWHVSGAMGDSPRRYFRPALLSR